MKTKSIQFENYTALLFIEEAGKVYVKWFDNSTMEEITEWPRQYDEVLNTLQAKVSDYVDYKKLLLWSY